MRRWGRRGREPITRYRACKRERSTPNHLNPMAYEPLLANVVFYQSISNL